MTGFKQIFPLKRGFDKFSQRVIMSLISELVMKNVLIILGILVFVNILLAALSRFLFVGA